ncbi:unnamed protein product [Knipowitschia caucasica]|uniref:alpha-1,6-mannosyl-glycoprotein 6-beta-N-acetylglucosaminyltransferase n=1 Tax=Knipowitschia caucasica TaxID=637954 RepID=A0AAV2KLI8_KNICA
MQPMGPMVERIQALALNMSQTAVKVEQILQQRSAVVSSRDVDAPSRHCEIPKDPHFPECSSKIDWMRARWTSDPCYAYYGVDGSDCSFLIYLSEVEWFCPPQPGRNQSILPPSEPPPKQKVQLSNGVCGQEQQADTE